MTRFVTDVLGMMLVAVCAIAFTIDAAIVMGMMR